LTPKGAQTREKIVRAAAELMSERSVAQTRLEDVQAVAGVSTGQVYHYFPNKHALVMAVIEYQTEQIVGGQEPMLAQLNDMASLRTWRDFLVEHQRRIHCVGGCPIGSLGSELAEINAPARASVAASFHRWHASILAGLQSMIATGTLPSDADADTLALEVLTALQGGLLLTQLQRDTRPLEVALDGMLARLDTLRKAVART
jgi:AcrR family transcriptional regulator